MSAFLDETGTLITVDHSNPLPVALVAGFTSLNDGELKTASYANPLPVTIVTTDYTEAELPDADDVADGTEVFNTTYQVKMRSNGTSWEWLGVGRSTWVDKPAIAPLGQVICITDVGENGILCRGDGAKWIRMHQVNLYNLATPIVLTGTTLETTMLTFSIPASLMNKRGRLSFIVLLSLTNNANLKTLKVKFGGQTLATVTSTSQAALGFNTWLLNLNSETAQRNSNAISFTIDTTIANDLVITGQLANSADTLTLIALSMEII